MPAEPSAAGYGCREASEVMATIVGRRGRSASGEWRYSIGRVRSGVWFFLGPPSQPAGRGCVERLGQRTWAVVRDKPGSEAHCSTPSSLRVEPCLS